MRIIITVLPALILISTIAWANDISELINLAKQGVASAQYEIAFRYSSGLFGVPKNDHESIEWYRKAAEQGHSGAQFFLGLSYESSVFPDYKEAMKWYRKSAEQGYSNAQFSLGMLYAEGKCVPQNDFEAIKWLSMSTKLPNNKPITWFDVEQVSGHKYNLGTIYEFGKPLPRDLIEAAKWYQSAAGDGHFTSQVTIGEFYLEGKGLPQNYAEAYFWLNLARCNGVNVRSAISEKIQINCDLAASKLTPGKRREVQDRCNKWLEDFENRKAKYTTNQP